MRRQYSIGLIALLAAACAPAAAPCPPELTAIAGRVAELRAVEGELAPPCRQIERAALTAELDRKLRRDLPIQPELFLEALARVGLMRERPADVYPRLLAFYSSQVLGFYEPESDEMVIVAGGEAGVPDLVWAHELAHAAQERRFGLPSRLLAMGRDGDAQRAASAIAEGDAMLVMLLLAQPGANMATLRAAQAAVQAQGELLSGSSGVPEFFVADLIFPYSNGFAAVLDAYAAGGWSAVDRLLARPPASTAALLHPSRAAPGPPLTDADLDAVPPGWEEVLSDTFGEWTLRFALARNRPADAAAALAAGWDADRLRLIRNRAEPERWALDWRLRARSAAEREAVEQALRADLPAMLAGLDPTRPLELRVAGEGRELAVRAGWPVPVPRPAPALARSTAAASPW